MKKMFQAFSLLGVLALAGVASAAGMATTFRITVPFAFTVGTEELPAGTYTVEKTDSGVVLIVSHAQGAAVLTVPSQVAKAGVNTGLVFQGGHLVAVQIDGEGTRGIPARTTLDRSLTVSQ
ncbi:MAG: hypothetical protein JOY54_06325 [Acidobacteriaceae bacterium]|nr:hypothetical protein [Acidobacteriaceae bacterium]